jgi:hypothetical protein
MSVEEEEEEERLVLLVTLYFLPLFPQKISFFRFP